MIGRGEGGWRESKDERLSPRTRSRARARVLHHPAALIRITPPSHLIAAADCSAPSDCGHAGTRHPATDHVDAVTRAQSRGRSHAGVWTPRGSDVTVTCGRHLEGEHALLEDEDEPLQPLEPMQRVRERERERVSE